ncbi:non-ribosomal peptide synthetase [Paenibacillus monticola]|uniref:Amino acid adenylation domain-containing protein n=1 Tax=Paenibacillus monticola TaxID=2666075 RepID=A0A7X2L011_9BACL|nr:non-ribosomal peptide synthetase [Paenibacillus monticola]MRN52282.1 amino acid adenylation domain-containing protein [Paenibacillus monticola]
MIGRLEILSTDNNIKDIYFLTPMQEGMLFYHILNQENDAYFQQLHFSVEGTLNYELFEQSIRQLVSDYDILRTVFVYKKVKKTVQVVLKDLSIPVELADISTWNLEQQQLFIKENKEKEIKRGFDLTRGPLMRITVVKTAETKYEIIWNFHHIILDGWSLGNLLLAFRRNYKLLQRGKTIHHRNTLPFSNHIKWLERTNSAEAHSYWDKYLTGYSTPVTIPGNAGAENVNGYKAAQIFYKFSSVLSSRLEETSRKNGVTLSSLLQMLWGILLNKYNGVQDSVFATVVSGRNPDMDGMERMVGMFINAIPVRVRYDDTMSIRDLIHQFWGESFASQQYDFASLPEIQSRTSLNKELINHTFIFENYPLGDGLYNKSFDFWVTDLQVYGHPNYDYNIVVTPGHEQIEIKVSYNDLVYSHDMIMQSLEHFERIAELAVDNLDLRVGEIGIVTDKEKAKLLYEFNPVPSENSQPYSLIHDGFELVASTYPSNIAVVYENQRLTYLELSRKSNLIAQSLILSGVTKNSVVGVGVQPGIEAVVAILGVLKAGGAYLPIDPSHPIDRVNNMLNQCGCKFLITGSETLDGLLAETKVIRFNEIDMEPLYDRNYDIEFPTVSAEDIAYVIFTSGTTGVPKGVKVSHSNLIHYVSWFKQYSKISSADRTVILSSLAYDLSYTSFYSGLLTGCQIHLLSQEAYSDSNEVVKYIRMNEITFFKGTPSHLSMILYSREFYRTEACNSLELVVLGGEEIQALDIEKFNKKYPKTRFMNHYGPAECTVGSVAMEIESAAFDNFKSVPVLGRPISHAKVLILDKSMNLLPVGVCGEIYISGAGISSGYINDAIMTEQRFVASPFQSNEKIYRTGDLGRWLVDGTIQFLGRIDDQIKIRGFRVELGEIKSKLQSHPKVAEAIVIQKIQNNKESIVCAYYVSEDGVEAEELRSYLKNALPEYMIPAYLQQIDSIPLTVNGKIDRNKLPEPGFILHPEEKFSMPESEIECELARIWESILQVKNIGVNDHFFQIGGHSLKAIMLTTAIYKHFSVEIPLRSLFQLPTIKELALYIEESTISKEFVGIQTVAHPTGKYASSSVQKRIYALSSYDNESINYNRPFAMLLSGPLNISELQEAIHKMILRHEALRTSFENEEGNIIQKIWDSVKFNLDFADMEYRTEKEVNVFLSELVTPFQLEQAPLMRGMVIRLANCKHILFLDMHHIIWDGVSTGIFTKELFDVYSGEKLPGLSVQYKDYTEWQRQHLLSDEYKQKEQYWLNHLGGEIPALNLPLDYGRPSIQSFDGDFVHFSIHSADYENLKALAAATETTMFMLIYCAFCVLMAKYSGQEEIIVGTVSAGRSRPEIQGVLGMFVNTLPVRTFPDKHKTFVEYLLESKQTLLDSYHNQDYPLEDIIESLNLTRDASRNPLFDVFVAFENESKRELKVNDIEISGYDVEYKVSKFDLSLLAEERGDGIDFRLEYCTRLFAKDNIKRMILHLMRLIYHITKNSNKQIGELQFLDDEEMKQLLQHQQDFDVDYPVGKTAVQLFEEQVNRTPDHIAISFDGIQLTYRELNSRANRLAWRLRELHVCRDQMVGIMLERSPEMVIGILGILKAGGAYLPIEPSYPQERIRFMLEDSGAQILITQKEYMEDISFEGTIVNIFDEDSGNEANLPLVNKPDDLIYMIYTSGTTGKPKGVMIEHRNLVRLMVNNKMKFDFHEHDVWTLFHSFCFDFSVWEMYGALLYGGKLVIVPKLIAQDTRAFIQMLEREKVTVLNQTPTAFYSLINEEMRMSDIRLWIRYVIFGGETLKPMLLKLWKVKYPSTKLINMYGITETTVHVTYKEIGDQEINANVSNIGKAIPTVRTYILDSSLHPVPIGIPGELCIGGEGVARGYRNRDQLTAEKFIYVSGIHERLYRSGDLARFLSNGEIEYMGRIDSQVKIRGYRIELGEIERQLLQHDDIIDATVVDCNNHLGEKCLCAYIVVRRELKARSVRTFLAASIPEYMIPAYILSIDSVPLSSNGKADRNALPKPDFSAYQVGEYQAPTNKTEEILAGIWKEVLAVDKIGILDSFFDLGGHSLKAISLLAKVEKELNIAVSLRSLFVNPTIEKLAALIQGTQRTGAYPAIVKTQASTYFPVAPAQRRIYALSGFYPESTNYNIPCMIMAEGSLDKKRLHKALRALQVRHESLRVSFHLSDGALMQKLEEPEIAVVEEAEVITGIGLGEDWHTPFIKPFDLQSSPLLRANLITVDPQKSILILDMHHIICDGKSLSILYEELIELYAGRDLPPVVYQYRDYVHWQNAVMAGSQFKASESYWVKQFEGELPVLQLSTDYPRPAIQSQKGHTAEVVLDTELVQKLSRIAAETESTLFMVFLAAYNILLAKYSSQDDIIVGTVTSGRMIEPLQRIVGMFVNTLPLRNRPTSELSCREFLEEVKKGVLDAFEHQEYPFDVLVEQLGLRRDVSRSPLFDTILTFNEQANSEINVDGTTFKIMEVDSQTAKFDLVTSIERNDKEIRILMNFCTALFSLSTIYRMQAHFIYIIKQFAENLDERIGDMELVNEQERNMLFSFNQTKVSYPNDATVVGLFEEQVQHHPDQVAVFSNDNVLTYAELNRKANQLAHKIREIAPDKSSIVGIMTEPSVEMLIGILGVLKAGCAYLPIAHDYPADRIEYMLKNSAVRLLLTKNKYRKNLSFDNDVIILDDSSIYRGDCQNHDVKGEADDLAYVIYTSGSSGQPKGVMVAHKSLVNLSYWHKNYFNITAADKSVKYAGFGFDASVWEIFPYLLSGSTIHVIDEDLKLNMHKLNQYFEEHHITISFLPTQVCEQFIGYGNTSLRILLTGGDKLKKFIPERYQLFNNYGPTENTVVTTCHLVESIDQVIPIGKPIANNQIFILDRDMHLTPIGVPGELCIAGESLAVGYLNLPDLTASKFIQNPYAVQERLYKTGDLARWTPDGSIEFLGRIDQQVKIRGNRVELGEIEAQLIKHTAVEDAVVVCKEDPNGIPYLMGYFISGTTSDPIALKEFLGTQLPAFMVPLHLIQLSEFPVTPNGKVDKNLLTLLELPKVANPSEQLPGTATEQTVGGIWNKLLNLESISVHRNFFDAGGDSLKTMLLISLIEKELGVKLSVVDVFNAPSIYKISRIIDLAERSTIPRITQVSEAVYSEGHFPLAMVQRRMIALSMLDETGILYNAPFGLEIIGNLDVVKVNHVFQQLIHRHEILRTSFHVVDNQPVQRIHDNVEFEVNFMDVSSADPDVAIKQCIKSFVLDEPPLIRVALLRVDEERFILLIDMHHIICDGVSADIMMHEFAVLYQDMSLTTINLQYKDFAVWQNEFSHSNEMKQQEQYWLDQLKGDIPRLNMPTDYPKSKMQSYYGKSKFYVLGEQLSLQLEKFAQQNKVTLFQMLLAGYYILLHKVTGKEDILVGCAVAGRHHAGLDQMLGLFVNTLVLRNFPNHEIEVGRFLSDVKQNVLQAFEHQDYPFDQLVERLAITRNAEENALFDTLLSWQESETELIRIPGLHIKNYYVRHDTSKFDCSLFAFKEDNGINLCFNFNTQLFNEKTIDMWSKDYLSILTAITQDINIPIKDIEVHSEQGYQRLESVMDRTLQIDFS